MCFSPLNSRIYESEEFQFRNLPISDRDSLCRCCRCLGVKVYKTQSEEKKIFSFVSNASFSWLSGSDCVNLRRIFPTLSTAERSVVPSDDVGFLLYSFFFGFVSLLEVYNTTDSRPLDDDDTHKSGQRKRISWNRKTVRHISEKKTTHSRITTKW